MKTTTLNQPQQRKKGFALIATITLSGLLMLLALAMLSLSSVEVRQETSSNHYQRAQANARMAAMIALGEMQMKLGADQRVTASASILDDSVAPQKGNWTMVWDTTSWDPQDPISTRDDAYMGALISGEQYSEPGDLSSAVVTLSDAVTANDADWITLVGEKSVDEEDDYVYAPRVDVLDESDTSKGGYAYWVGDEGVKARFDVEVDEDAAIETWAKAGRMGAPLGTGIHMLTDMGGYTDYLPDGAAQEDLEKFISQGTLDQSVIAKDVIRRNFHDITTHHTGLLVDNRWGGIRRDLSTAFEMDLEDFGDITEFNAADEVNQTDIYSTFTPSDLNSNPLYYSDDTDKSMGYLYEIPVDTINRYRGPTWDLLRNHYRTYKKEINDLNFRGVSVSSGSDALVAHGVMPLSYNRQPGTIDNLSLGSAHSHPHSDSNASNFYPIVSAHGVAGSYGGPKVGARNEPTVQKMTPQLLRMVIQYGLVREDKDYFLTMNPVFTLHNPYNYPIEFYSFSVDFSYIHYLMSFDVRYTKPNDTAGFENFSMTKTSGHTKTMQTFRIRPGASGNNRLEPGEVRVVSVDGGFQEADGPDYIIPMKMEYDLAGGVAIGGSLKKTLDIKTGSELNVTAKFRRAATGNYQIPTLYVRLHHPIAAEGGPFDLFDPVQVLTNDSTILDRELTTLIQTIRIVPEGAVNLTLNKPETSIPSLSDETGGLGLVTLDLGLKDFGGEVAPFSDFNYRSLAADTLDYNKKHAVAPNWDLELTTSLLDSMSIPGANATSAFWGESKSSTGGGQSKIVLFELPRSPMASLGGLQHADTSKFNNHAAHSIGRSRPQVGQEDLTVLYNKLTPTRNAQAPCHYQFDTSWAANEALWDRYYFSGINWGAASGQTYSTQTEAVNALVNGDIAKALVNPRMTLVSRPSSADVDNLKDYKKMGEYLGVKGAFNVNSTSIEAWKAVLSGLSGREVSYLAGSSLSTLTSDERTAPISRFMTPSGDESDDYSGFRALSETELSDLAEAIVEEVKERGPFMGLSDFVNRRLIAEGTNETGKAGALQAAIDKSNINNSLSIGSTNTSINGLKQTAPTAGDGMARHLNQGDVINLLGPIMATRSDTFVIRAYGDSKDSAGNIVARAWCEMVVQRTPEWVIDPGADSTIQNPDYPTDNSMDSPILRQWKHNDSLPEAAERFGRRFEVSSFRWLSGQEI